MVVTKMIFCAAIRFKILRQALNCRNELARHFKRPKNPPVAGRLKKIPSHFRETGFVF
jgi:hypothetical protein